MLKSASLSSRGRPISAGPSERDRKLIQQVRAGDDEAFESLRRFYEAFVCGLIRYVLSWPDEKGDVEDVEQETWLKVYRSLGSFKGESSFGTWLSKVARNKCYDHLRKKKPRKIFVSIATLSNEETHDCEKWFAKHPVKEWDDFVEEVQPIADKAYAGLAPKELIVVNTLLDKLPPREISIQHGIPIKDVRRILDKFKRKCRKMRIEGLTRAERMRFHGRAKKRKRIAVVVMERGDPE